MAVTAETTASSEPSEHLDTNPFAPELITDPYAYYARLRSAGAVGHGPADNPNAVLLVARYAWVEAILRDARFERGGFFQRARSSRGAGPLARSLSRWILFLNPPDHTRLRTLVGGAFTPRAVERVQTVVERLVREHLDALPRHGEMDLVVGFAYPLPVQVICALLGVPGDEMDMEQLRRWSSALSRCLDVTGRPQPEIIARGNEAAAGLTNLFRGLIDQRRNDPRDDLITALVTAEQAGDRLDEEELLATCVLIFFGGHETTVDLIGTGVLSLLRHPEQLERLRANPRLIYSTVEELLRYESPSQRTERVAVEDVEIGGQRIPRGQRLLLFLGGANRDPEQFPAADRVDITRADNRHLAFGIGAHYCLGAPLARLEAQIAIPLLLERMPDLRLLTEAVKWRASFALRGLKGLPVGY